MSVQTIPAGFVYTTGQSLYLIRHAGGQVFNPTLNAGAGGYEAFNGAHWAQYAIAATEQGSSGYYEATLLAAAIAVPGTEVWYNNASPTLGDAPVGPVQASQGQSVVAVGGDPVAASNMQKAAGAMLAGAAQAGSTAQAIATNLTNAQALAAVGGSIVFAANATGAPNCTGRVIGASGASLTLAAPLSAVPAANDAFVIV